MTVFCQEQDGTQEFHPDPGRKRSSKLRISILLLAANGHQNCIKCTNADVWLRTPHDGRKGYLKRAVVIPINLKFSASVGFIQKEFITMHNHTILKC